MDPPLAKKWLRDFIVIATLSRIQAQLENEVLQSAQFSKKQPTSSSWSKHYFRLLPYLAHYHRDPGLLYELQQQQNQDSTTSIATTPNSSKQKPLGEVLPDHIIHMLQRKQREFIQLSVRSQQDHPSSLNLENFAASYATTKSQMYEDTGNQASAVKKGESKPYQPTVVEPLKTPMKQQQQRQAPGSSAKSYFDSLKKGSKTANNNQQQAVQQEQVVPMYLIANSNKVTIFEIVFGVLLLLVALGYYHFFR
jgi:hypothetical protein